LVPRVPTLILGLVMVLFALQCFLAGLNLDILINKERKSFEFKLIQLKYQKDRLVSSNDNV
jgi:hypothetical protein